MKDFLSELGKLPREYAHAKDYQQFLELSEETPGERRFSVLTEGIVLRDVSFAYPNTNKNAVEDVSLEIKKGMSVAVVGENGSGKTTLSRLLLGLYPAGSGTIEYDGIPIAELDQRSSAFSVVAQDFVQYHMTVGENIAISLAGDDERLDAFIKAYKFGGLIDSIGGLNMQLGSQFDGIDLSKGQWQQIAIARGMYKDSEVIVLDEPTAALDPIMEYQILTSFLELSHDKTSIIVSHRIGLCTKVDMIVVMEDGRVVESGNHRELMKLRGKYYRMYSAQRKWYAA